jgi:hypothetical protein
VRGAEALSGLAHPRLREFPRFLRGFEPSVRRSAGEISARNAEIIESLESASIGLRRVLPW